MLTQQKRNIPIFSWYCALPYDQKRRVAGVGIGIGLFVFMIFNIMLYHSGQLYERKKHQQYQSTFPYITPTPTPLPLICKGMYEFSVSTRGSAGFVRRGVLSPCDPKKGDAQKLQILVHGATVTNMVVELITDEKKQSIPLSQRGEQKDIWESTWIMDDSYDYTYTLIIKGISDGKEVRLPMTFR